MAHEYTRYDQPKLGQLRFTNHCSGCGEILKRDLGEREVGEYIGTRPSQDPAATSWDVYCIPCAQAWSDWDKTTYTSNFKSMNLWAYQLRTLEPRLGATADSIKAELMGWEECPAHGLTRVYSPVAEEHICHHVDCTDHKEMLRDAYKHYAGLSLAEFDKKPARKRTNMSDPKHRMETDFFDDKPSLEEKGQASDTQKEDAKSQPSHASTPKQRGENKRKSAKKAS
jgi:hypothetical protein